MIGNEEQAAQTLSTFDPAWMKDGTWLRGPQQTVNRFGQPFDFPRATVTGGTMQQGNEPIMGPGIGGAGDAGGTATTFSFQPILGVFSGNYFVGIYKNSKLISDFGDSSLGDNVISVTGLLSSLTPTSSDPGWIPVTTSGIGWLRVPITTGTSYPFTFGTAIIEATGLSSTPGPAIENDGGMGMPPVYTQVNARQKLFDMGADANGNPMIAYSWVNTPLRMEYGDYYSFDSSGGSNQPIFAAFPKPA